jgi:hypothetical protein
LRKLPSRDQRVTRKSVLAEEPMALRVPGIGIGRRCRIVQRCWREQVHLRLWSRRPLPQLSRAGAGDTSGWIEASTTGSMHVASSGRVSTQLLS